MLMSQRYVDRYGTKPWGNSKLKRQWGLGTNFKKKTLERDPDRI